MVLPQKMYLLYRNLLCFRQEEVDKAAHDDDQGTEQQENSPPEVTQGREEALSNECCENHVDADDHALAR